MSVDIPSEELCLELHVSVKSTRWSGLFCLHVFAELLVVPDTNCTVYVDYIIVWLLKGPSSPWCGPATFWPGGRVKGSWVTAALTGLVELWSHRLCDIASAGPCVCHWINLSDNITLHCSTLSSDQSPPPKAPVIGAIFSVRDGVKAGSWKPNSPPPPSLPPLLSHYLAQPTWQYAGRAWLAQTQFTASEWSSRQVVWKNNKGWMNFFCWIIRDLSGLYWPWTLGSGILAVLCSTG